jgi:hypothetical protein
MERAVREADGRIKPRAQAPGSRERKYRRAREAGDSAVVRFADSLPFFAFFTWGLRPRLYSAVRFADSTRKPKLALSVSCNFA